MSPIQRHTHTRTAGKRLINENLLHNFGQSMKTMANLNVMGHWDKHSVLMRNHIYSARHHILPKTPNLFNE